MTLTRHTWRYLAAILMIVAFVMPSMVHAHAGHTHGPTPVVVFHADHTATAELAQVDPADVGDPDKAKSHATCSCACCGGLMASEPAEAGRVWRSLRLALGLAGLAPPSQAPEALPEPPRSFA